MGTFSFGCLMLCPASHNKYIDQINFWIKKINQPFFLQLILFIFACDFTFYYASYEMIDNSISWKFLNSMIFLSDRLNLMNEMKLILELGKLKG